VHPTLGILAKSQAFFYALAFSQSDGVPPPAPARVTQTVGPLTRQGELLKKLPEAKPEKKLQEKCRLQVMKELPVEYFFVPKDK
jgi:hypothetical protein